jgi:ABC-2 type transport system permease protein
MWKEWLHILRDPRTIITVLVIPPMLVVLFGYAITYDVKHIPLVVSDSDHSAASRAMISAFTSSDYFRYTGEVNGEAAVEAGFRAGDYKGALVVPRGFGADLAAHRTARVEVVIDGSNTIIAGAAQRYALVIPQRFSAVYALKNAPPALAAKLTQPAIRLIPRILYNPDLSSINFIVPGLISLILMMIPAIITSVAIVREKESGTIEQLIVSPMRPHELMLGKITPYLIISGLNALMITLVGVLWFGIPFRGSAWLLAGMVILYMMSTVGIGLLISTVADTMLTAQVAAFLGTMLPAFMLSGFVFPIDSMPKILQYVSLIVPGRYFLVALRAIFLKGTGIQTFWQEALALLAFGVVLLAVSTLRFRKKVF